MKRLGLASKLERQLSTTNKIENLMGAVRYWLGLGYFDVGEVVDQLEEELDEAPSHEVLERAVSDAMRDQRLTSRQFCFFHQQCILHALDGQGLSLYIGAATHDADEVAMRPSQAVGQRVAAATAANDLPVEWDGAADTAI